MSRAGQLACSSPQPAPTSSNAFRLACIHCSQGGTGGGLASLDRRWLLDPRRLRARRADAAAPGPAQANLSWSLIVSRAFLIASALSGRALVQPLGSRRITARCPLSSPATMRVAKAALVLLLAIAGAQVRCSQPAAAAVPAHAHTGTREAARCLQLPSSRARAVWGIGQPGIGGGAAAALGPPVHRMFTAPDSVPALLAQLAAAGCEAPDSLPRSQRGNCTTCVEDKCTGEQECQEALRGQAPKEPRRVLIKRPPRRPPPLASPGCSPCPPLPRPCRAAECAQLRMGRGYHATEAGHCQPCPDFNCATCTAGSGACEVSGAGRSSVQPNAGTGNSTRPATGTE